MQRGSPAAPAFELAGQVRAGAAEHVLGHAGDVGQGQHARMAHERIVGSGRLGGEDVEAGGGDAAVIQRGEQRRLVDEAAARDVDDDEARVGSPTTISQPGSSGW